MLENIPKNRYGLTLDTNFVNHIFHKKPKNNCQKSEKISGPGKHAKFQTVAT
jgi:hypothetical protein